jgi:hypothetical protein
VTRTTTSRTRTAVTAKSGDKIVLEALAKELLSVCMTTLKTYGLNAGKLVELAASTSGERHGRKSAFSAVLAEAECLANLLNKWVENPKYRDATGRPAVLPLVRSHGQGKSKGKDNGCSFSALAREFFPAWSVANVVGFGTKTRVIEKVGRDKVAMINSTVLFTGNASLILAHLIRSVRRLFSTGDFNRSARSALLEGWPDRTSIVAVSDEDFSEFVKFIRPQVSDWAEMSNRWLFQRSQSGKNRTREKREAGLQIFVFRD